MKFCFWGSVAKGFLGNPIGGGEQQLALIAKSLNSLGHEIVIIDFDELENKTIDGILFYAINGDKQKHLPKYFVFYKLLKKINADIYYGRIRSWNHIIPLKIAHKLNAKFVYHLASDLDALTFIERWRGFYSKLSFSKLFSQFVLSELLFPIVLKKADVIFVQNSEQYQNLKNKGLDCIYEIKNLFLFDENTRIKTQTNDVQSATENDKYLLYVGSLDLRKGVLELDEIIRNNRNLNFIIIGKPRDKAGSQFVNKLLLYKNVKYIGQQPHNVVLDYLESAQALINTSFYEGFSNAFIEAWSLGIPVLSLFSNPSKVLNDYELGVYYNGEINKMSNEIAEDLRLNFNKENIIYYVKKYHDANQNAKSIICHLN